MHTIEEKLKDFILRRYKSLHEFSQMTNIPHSTFISILKRGIGSSNISNIIKICDALNISVDALANGEIEFKYKENKQSQVTDVRDIVNDVKSRFQSADRLVIDGQPIEKAGAESIIDAIDVVVEITKTKNRS